MRVDIDEYLPTEEMHQYTTFLRSEGYTTNYILLNSFVYNNNTLEYEVFYLKLRQHLYKFVIIGNNPLLAKTKPPYYSRQQRSNYTNEVHDTYNNMYNSPHSSQVYRIDEYERKKQELDEILREGDLDNNLDRDRF